MADPDEIKPEILELILRTSRVKGCHHVYSLSPRGHRVGIYFQQRRATLLAAAIRSRIGRDALKTCKIGIVGGGASGLTFLAAIKNEGAEEAYLYEAADEILGKGSNASHRLVHPNYNRWPLLGSMDVFTSLPVLNWYAASADKVIKQLQEHVAKDYDDLIADRVILRHKVERITQRKATFADPLRLTFTTRGPKRHADFEIVVIAAGFSNESSTVWGFNDYWSQEENFDQGEHKRPCTVYGIGDGALIDIIRCCAKDTNEAWLIPLGTIARLRPHHAVTILKDRPAHIDPRSTTFDPIEKKIQAHEESIRSVAWAMSRDDEAVANFYAAEEERFYRECVTELKRYRGMVLRFLESKLKPAAPSNLKPVLVGRLRHGFEPTSAPINKLLLAYLLETDRIVYSQRGQAQQNAELQALSQQPAATRRSSITICRFGAAKNFPLKKAARRGSGRVRIPPPSEGIEVAGPSKVFSETDAEAYLIDALSGITGGEYIYFDAMPHPLTRAHYGMDRDGFTRDARERSKPILLKFAQETLAATDVEFYPGRGAIGPKWVIFTALDNRQITERLLSIGGLDGNFLGAPIVVNTPVPDTGRAF